MPTHPLACEGPGVDVKLARNFNPDSSRTLAVADPKHEDTSFKVIDRRLFSENGEIRPEVVEQERRDDEAAAKKTAVTEANSKAAAQASSVGTAQPKPVDNSVGIIDGGQAAAGQRSFDSQSLANSAVNDLIPEAPG